MDDMLKRIKDLRSDLKMNTAQLGKLVGKGQSTISDIERGKTAIKADELPRFANALGVSVYKLLTGNDDDNRNIAERTGLSNQTINKIISLSKKKKVLLEMLINDEGKILSEKEINNPEFEPEKGFLDAFADYACGTEGNRIVEVKYSGSGTEDDPYNESIIEKELLAPMKYMIKLADGTLHDISEWKPDSKSMLKRLQIIRRKYLQNLEKVKSIPTAEEDDNE